MSKQEHTQTQTAGLDEAELEDVNGEELPEREAMSVISAPGDSLGAPPLAD